jgi:predicted enzyme related to lactoylglutathione lyase
MQNNTITHVEIPATVLAKAIRFYEKYLNGALRL